METEPPPEGLMPARVTAAHRKRFELITPVGPLFGRLKTAAYRGGGEAYPTVGDFVHFRAVDGGDAQIMRTLPRKSQFTRRDPDPNAGEQVVAANVDYAFIMTSLNRDFNVNRIERYLVLARRSGAAPVLVLTKSDLADDVDALVSAAVAVADDADVVTISVADGTGLDSLDKYIAPRKTVVFLGMSGVGKSSLLNALMGREVMAVGDIREDDGRGRHTTTRRELFMLPSGAMVIDTPGMRSIGMWDAGEGVGETFPDVEALLGGCRFSDCRHETEPGCAILEALAGGTLDATRWENYKNLKREAMGAEEKAAEMRKKWAQYKSIKNARTGKQGGQDRTR
jgi:ribosome biogenesis GTPase